MDMRAWPNDSGMLLFQTPLEIDVQGGISLTQQSILILSDAKNIFHMLNIQNVGWKIDFQTCPKLQGSLYGVT